MFASTSQDGPHRGLTLNPRLQKVEEVHRSVGETFQPGRSGLATAHRRSESPDDEDAITLKP